MVRAGGSASRTISDNNTPDPGEGRSLSWKRPKDDTPGPRWTPDVQGFPVLGSLTPAEKDRRDCAVQKCAAVVDKDSELDPLCRPEGGGSHRAPLGRLIKAPRRQMRPAWNGGSTRRMTSARRNDAGMRSAARPISAEAVEFSPAPAQARNEQAGRKTKSSRTGGISLMAVVESPLPTAGGGGGGDVNRRRGSKEVIRRTASIGRGGGVLSGAGNRTAETIWTEDHVQRNRRKQSDGSCRAPLIQSGGGGGG